MRRLAVLCALAAALAGAGTARALTVPVPVTPPATGAVTVPGGSSDGPDLDGVQPSLGADGTSDGPELD